MDRNQMHQTQPLTRKSEVALLGRTMTLGKVIITGAAIAGIIGAAAASFGFQMIGPAQVNQNLGARIDTLSVQVAAQIDTLSTTLKAETNRGDLLQSYVQFLVVKDCLDMTEQKKRDMAIRGISCEDVLSGGKIR